MNSLIVMFFPIITPKQHHVKTTAARGCRRPKKRRNGFNQFFLTMPVKETTTERSQAIAQMMAKVKYAETVL